ncbi:MAG TPA: enoyl-CoA hydratase-related protein, partial [Bacteroidota bacterium]
MTRTYETVVFEIRNHVALVRVNRPDKLNALNRKAKAELQEVFSAVKSDDDLRVVILTGTGEKSFVAGTDIKELSELDQAKGKEFSRAGQNLLTLIENLGKPVIAAVNGYALGGGCELALACHLRIASENAKFGQPEVNLGVIPGYGGTQRLARLVGKGRAMELILTGNSIDAEEAYRIGLVSRVVPQNELFKVAQEVAELIASKPQVAVRLAIKAVNMTEEANLTDGQDL